MGQVSLSNPAVADLSASCKLVYLAVRELDEPTQAEIAEELQMSPRTVRYALARLDEVDAITSRPSLEDARQSRYSLAE